MDGEAEFCDHLQRATYKIDLAFDGHVGIVHRTQTDDALHPFADEFFAQQFDSIDFDQHLTIEILNLVSFGTAITIYTGLVGTIAHRLSM